MWCLDDVAGFGDRNVGEEGLDVEADQEVCWADVDVVDFLDEVSGVDDMMT